MESLVVVVMVVKLRPPSPLRHVPSHVIPIPFLVALSVSALGFVASAASFFVGHLISHSDTYRLSPPIYSCAHP